MLMQPNMVSLRMVTACLSTLVATLACAVDGSATEPRFDRDVMAVLSKAGCNLGTCHGNLHGKGGLHLSLRGQDPDADYLALTHEFAGRRINRNLPDKSLVLLKPLASVPHEGGRRFEPDSVEHEILRAWIAAGTPGPDTNAIALRELTVTPLKKIVFAPEEAVQIRVTARFADGSTRDVTRLATYEAANLSTRISNEGMVEQDKYGETTVAVRYLNQQVAVRLAFLPAKRHATPSLSEPANYIDQHIFEKLAELDLQPTDPVPDNSFLRRAYFDLLGIPPTGDEARAFATDPSDGKRERLVDELLNRPEFADHWALKWSDLLHNEEKVMDPRGVQVFHAWIRDSFARGLPLDEFVKQLVSGQGSTYEHPPANFYRPIRDPLSRGETTARLFLGVRLQCAKCHNHPFDHWTQDDYYAWAGVFARVDYEMIENKRRDKLDKNEFQGEQRVFEKDEGEVTNARTGQPATPQFLAAEATSLDADKNRLNQLADWLTSPENETFAQAQVNRIWYHLMGRGLVDPVDDFRITNPASHPELLEAMAKDFVRHEFDIRFLIRQIMTSHAYQLASHGSDDDLSERNYARATVRRLSAEQLLDAQCQLLATPAEFNGYDVGIRAGQIPGVQRVRLRDKAPSADDRFLTVFGKPKRLMACECERSDETTLTQAFYLLSGESLHRRLEKSPRLKELARVDHNESKVIDELYWSALSRPPTAVEMDLCRQQLKSTTGNRAQAIQDLAWALINSKEFMFRH